MKGIQLVVVRRILKAVCAVPVMSKSFTYFFDFPGLLAVRKTKVRTAEAAANRVLSNKLQKTGAFP